MISLVFMFLVEFFFVLKQDQLSMFETNSDEGIIGCSSISKAFRVYNFRRKKVEESINVKFNEEAYPAIIEYHSSFIMDDLTTSRFAS